jgi:GTP-binding protein
VLLHVLDIRRALREGEKPDPKQLVDDYKAIRNELKAYSPALAEKRELVILNKTDLVNDDVEPFLKAFKKAKVPVWMSISAATQHNIAELKKKLLKIVLEERDARLETRSFETAAEKKEVPVLKPHLLSDKMGSYRADTDTPGVIRISGTRLEQFTVMTDFSNEGAVNRFKDVLDRVGVLKIIRRQQKLHPGKDVKVYIGKMRVDECL